jgi:hypothetical protein
MSAQLTYEPRTIEQAACYVDELGYVLCAACYHSGVDHPYDRSLDVSGNCDRCSTLLAYSVELVDGWASIEHTPAKMF